MRRRWQWMRASAQTHRLVGACARSVVLAARGQVSASMSSRSNKLQIKLAPAALDWRERLTGGVKVKQPQAKRPANDDYENHHQQDFLTRSVRARGVIIFGHAHLLLPVSRRRTEKEDGRAMRGDARCERRQRQQLRHPVAEKVALQSIAWGSFLIQVRCSCSCGRNLRATKNTKPQ